MTTNISDESRELLGTIQENPQQFSFVYADRTPINVRYTVVNLVQLDDCLVMGTMVKRRNKLELDAWVLCGEPQSLSVQQLIGSPTTHLLSKEMTQWFYNSLSESNELYANEFTGMIVARGWEQMYGRRNGHDISY